MKNYYLPLIISLSVLMSGCSTMTPRGQSQVLANLDHPQVSHHLTEGQTTKHQVRKIFGNPAQVEIRDGKEVWIYKFNKPVRKGLGNIPLLGMFIPGTREHNPKMLTIMFNKADIVEKFHFSSQYANAVHPKHHHNHKHHIGQQHHMQPQHNNGQQQYMMGQSHHVGQQQHTKQPHHKGQQHHHVKHAKKKLTKY